MRPQIREATKFDIPALLEMLNVYKHETPIKFMEEVEDSHLSILLSEIIAGKGIALIAEKEKPIGMLIAAIAPSKWIPTKFLLMELAYWVNHEERGGSAGYRLIKEYQCKGLELKTANRIENFLISKMSTSPDLKFNKFGFTKLEEYWVQ
jgi:N-acetylglutamate synthase-like GNAT family acetyltransferase